MLIENSLRKEKIGIFGLNIKGSMNKKTTIYKKSKKEVCKEIVENT